MRLEHVSPEKLKGDLLKIFGKHLDLKKYKIFFFGSRVNDSGSQLSDIDIGIEGPEKISLAVMARIKEEIEKLPILYKIDVIDFSSVSDKFKEVARQNMEIIN